MSLEVRERLVEMLGKYTQHNHTPAAEIMSEFIVLPRLNEEVAKDGHYFHVGVGVDSVNAIDTADTKRMIKLASRWAALAEHVGTHTNETRREDVAKHYGFKGYRESGPNVQAIIRRVIQLENGGCP